MKASIKINHDNLAVKIVGEGKELRLSITRRGKGISGKGFSREELNMMLSVFDAYCKQENKNYGVMMEEIKNKAVSSADFSAFLKSL